MKKLILTLVLGVFAFGASGFGSASDCVKKARNITLQAANAMGEHPNDDWHDNGVYYQVYMAYYTACLES